MNVIQRLSATVVFTTALLLALPAAAAVPATTLVEGALLTSAGGPVADGDYAITFSIYKDAEGGSAVWFEGPVTIAVKAGAFTYALGAATPITQDALVALGGKGFLGVKVGTDPELTRKPINAVLFSMRSAAAEALVCSGCIGSGHMDAQVLAPYAKTADLAKVATSGKFSDLEGGPDLSAYTKTAALAKIALSGAYSDLTGAPDLSAYLTKTDLADVAVTGAYADLSGTPTLAKVATSGSYGDLKDPPTLAKLDAACGTGLVIKGLKADGSYDCVKAMDPSALPADAIDEISNGLIHNQFVDSVKGKADVGIPDNNPIGVSDVIDFPDIGIAQKIGVSVEIANSKINTLTVSVIDPAGGEYVLHQKSGSGTALKTTYPDPTKTVSGDLTTWVGKNPKGKWYLKVIDSDYLNNATDGKVTAWSIDLQTLSSKKIQVKGDLIVDGKFTNAALQAQLDAIQANLPKPAMFRWKRWSTYSYSGGWYMDNNAAMFGGVAPSNWSDGNNRAVHFTSDKNVLRSFFINKGWAGTQATICADQWRDYESSTNAQHCAVLFRVKNSTGSNINWQPYFYYSSYGSWNEWAGVALNGNEIWSSGGNNCQWCTVAPAMAIPANRTSTVIINVGSGPPTNWYGTNRHVVLAFYNNSLSLPSGLAFVDDFDTASGGWEQ